MKHETDVPVAQTELDRRRALASTERFYEGHAAEYFQRTVHADLLGIYERFLPLVPAGGRILDAGCGSGRDLREFVRRGYRAEGIDASRELVRLAQEYSSAPCRVMRLELLTDVGRFDAIWACASLLHLPKAMLDGVLRRLARALKSHGVMFASVQLGQGEVLADDGRFFAYYAKAEFEAAVTASGFDLIEAWISEDRLPGRDTVEWINVIASVARRGILPWRRRTARQEPSAHSRPVRSRMG